MCFRSQIPRSLAVFVTWQLAHRTSHLAISSRIVSYLKPFTALRDGDRFFYRNDPAIRSIDHDFGVDYRLTLAEIVKLNTGVTLQANVFKFAG